MTPRYFYRDPLEAAYMAKHYGMKLGYPQRHIQYPFVTIDDTSIESLLMSDARGKFYVHPESEHILEPQVGDLIKLDGDWYYEILDKSDYTDAEARFFITKDAICNFTDVDEFWWWMQEGKIILRQGRPFFWPEMEENQ